LSFSKTYRERMRMSLEDSLSEYLEEEEGAFLFRDHLLEIIEDLRQYHQQKVDHLQWLSILLTEHGKVRQ